MIEVKEVTINGTGYRVTQLGTKVGSRLFVRLARLAGPSILSALGGMDSLSDLANMNLAEVGPAIKDLCDKTLEDEMEHLCTLFEAKTEISTEPGKWIRLAEVSELHFAGAYKEMFQWLGFCIKANYEDFLGGSIASANALTQAAKR